MPIDLLTLGAALLTGLLGGVHCAAMCGGIATGFSALGGRNTWWNAALPNLGRVLGYVLAGALAGGIGGGIVQLARSPTLALGLRMAVGLVLIVAALRLLDTRRRLGFLARPGTRIWALLQPLQRRLMPADTWPRRLALGMLWGCCLLYTSPSPRD